MHLINNTNFFSEKISIFANRINKLNELKLEKHRVENPKIHSEESLFKNNNHAFALQP